MLVFTEWLKENNLYTNYLNNTSQKDFKKIKEISPESWINSTFLWSVTPEGHDFWRDVSIKWKAAVHSTSEIIFEPTDKKAITYQDLLNGYILQKEDIIENIHGFKGYQVVKGARWFLKNNNERNDAIYKYLKAEKPNNLGCFPEFETAEDLTKEVIRLFKLSPYKVGDSVVIKQISTETRGPFGVTPTMSSFAGKTARITEIQDIVSYDLLNPTYNGDFHKYCLDVDLDYIWSSNLFDRAALTNPKQEQQGLLSPADTKETIQITITKKRKFNITL